MVPVIRWKTFSVLLMEDGYGNTTCAERQHRRRQRISNARFGTCPYCLNRQTARQLAKQAERTQQRVEKALQRI